MTVCNNESDELEKLLVDVQRTIRDNDQFIRHLKEESVDQDSAEEEPDTDINPDDGVYEEL